MVTLSDFNALLDVIAVGVDRLEAALQELKDKVNAGGVVSQAELEALHAKVATISNDITDPSKLG